MIESEYYKERKQHTINAINIVAQIKGNLFNDPKITGFDLLYKEIYPSICQKDQVYCFDNDSKEHHKMCEICRKEPEEYSEKDKAYLIKHFDIFLNLFGVGLN